jgi:hypothetical protein
VWRAYVEYRRDKHRQTERARRHRFLHVAQHVVDTWKAFVEERRRLMQEVQRRQKLKHQELLR